MICLWTLVQVSIEAAANREDVNRVIIELLYQAAFLRYALRP